MTVTVVLILNKQKWRTKELGLVLHELINLLYLLIGVVNDLLMQQEFDYGSELVFTNH